MACTASTPPTSAYTAKPTSRRLYGLSGDAASSERWHSILPDPRAGALTSDGNPTTLPSWRTEADIDMYTAEFGRTGFRGGLNWYRNIDRTWELLAPYSGASVTQPTLFLWGVQGRSNRTSKEQPICSSPIRSTRGGMGVGAPVDGLATTALEAYPVRQDWEGDPPNTGLILSPSLPPFP